jgi:hypothetical protein
MEIKITKNMIFFQNSTREFFFFCELTYMEKIEETTQFNWLLVALLRIGQQIKILNFNRLGVVLPIKNIKGLCCSYQHKL